MTTIHTAQNEGDAWVCEDCYFAHHYGPYQDANGVWYSNANNDTPADRQPLKLLEGLELSDNTDSETGEGIDTFSSSSCDGCGSTLGGARYRLHWREGRTASKRTAASDVCPKCGAHMDDVMVYNAPSIYSMDENVLVAKCGSCGWSGSKRKAASRRGLNDAGGGGSTPDDDADTGLGDAFDESGSDLYSVQPNSPSGPLRDTEGNEMVTEPTYDSYGMYPPQMTDLFNSTRQQVAMRKGAPFADYADFADCVSKNSDKDDPDAYCGYIKHKVEDNKESRKLAEIVGPFKVGDKSFDSMLDACEAAMSAGAVVTDGSGEQVADYTKRKQSAKYRGDLDRSVAFTILLEVMPGYADSPDDGGATITAFLNDWYEDPGTDMYAFAKQWVQGRTASRRLSRRDLAMANAELARFAAADWITVTVDASTLDEAVAKVKEQYDDVGTIGQQRKVGDGKVEVKYLKAARRAAARGPDESYPHVILRVTGGARSLEEVQAYLYSNWHAQQIEDGTIFISGHDIPGFGMNVLRDRLLSGLIGTEIVGHTGSDEQPAIHPPGQGVTWATKRTAAEKYRVTQDVGSPGKWVVQKWYPDNQLYHDVGDAVDSRQAAEEKLRQIQSEGRRRTAAGSTMTPTPDGGGDPDDKWTQTNRMIDAGLSVEDAISRIHGDDSVPLPPGMEGGFPEPNTESGVGSGGGGGSSRPSGGRDSVMRTHRALLNVPINEVCRGDVLVPPDGLVDARRNRVAKVEGFSGMWVVSFANGTATPPLANGLVNLMRPLRRTAAQIDDPEHVWTLNPDDPDWIGNFTDAALNAAFEFWSSETGQGAQPYLPGYANEMVRMITEERTRRQGGRKQAAGPRSAVAGEGAYVTDQYNSGIREEVAAGTVAHGRLVGMTMFGESYAWTVDGVSGDMWSLGGNWSETTTATRKIAYDLECYSCGKKGDNETFGLGNKRKCPDCGSEEVHSPDAGKNWGKGSARRVARSLNEIADEIRKDWKSVNFAAAPYLDAMRYLDSMSDNFGADSAQAIVAYFLSNSSGWKGETAKRVKAELRAMQKGGAKLANTEDEESAYTVRDPRNPRGLYGGERNILLQDRALELHDEEERRQLEMRELEHRAPAPTQTKSAARSDYAHWNEDQDYMWWMEEGRHPSEPPEPEDFYDDYGGGNEPEEGEESTCELCGQDIVVNEDGEWVGQEDGLWNCGSAPRNTGHQPAASSGYVEPYVWESRGASRRSFVREGGILSDILNFGNPDKWGPVHCEPGQAIEDCLTVEEWEKKQREKEGSLTRQAVSASHVVVDETDGMVFERGPGGELFNEETATAYAALRNSELREGRPPFTVKKLSRTAMPAPSEMGVKVGDIFYNSWGYDQTNIDFYEVIRLTGQGVEVQPIGKHTVQANGPGGNQVVPAKGYVRDWDVILGIDRGDPKKSKVCRLRSGYNGKPSIVLKSGEHWGYLWEGGSLHETDVMFGH